MTSGSLVTIFALFSFVPVFAQRARADPRFSGDWSTIGGNNSRTGYQEATLGTHQFVPVWAINPNQDSLYQEPIVADGKVFVVPRKGLNTRYQLESYSLLSGEHLWTRTYPPVIYLSPPTYFQNHLYFLSTDIREKSHFRSLDANTGDTIWEQVFQGHRGTPSPPAVNQNGAWINGGSSNGVFGFTLEGSESFLSPLPQSYRQTPTLQGDRLFTWVGNDLNEHNSKTGEIIWSLTLEEGFYNSGGFIDYPVVTDEEAFVTTRSGTLVCVDLATRQLRWETKTPFPNQEDRNFWGMPAVSKELVFIHSRFTREIIAFDITTGEQKMIYAPDRPVEGRQPMVLGDHLLITGQLETYVFEITTGKLSQTLPTAGYLSYSNGFLVNTKRPSSIITYPRNQIEAYFANDVPDITTRALPPLTTWSPYSAQIEVTHLDQNEALTFELIDAPSYLSISETGLITGLLNDNPSSFTTDFQVRVTDGITTPVSQSFTLAFRGANGGPVVTPLTVPLKEDGPSFSIPLADFILDEETPLDDLFLLFYYRGSSTNLPIASTSTEDGILTVTPRPNLSGIFEMKLLVRDEDNHATTGIITIIVSPEPDPPEINPLPNQLANTTADPISLNLAAYFSDPDPGDALTYTLTANTNPQIFSNPIITNAELTLPFAPYLSGSSDLTITATDSTGLTASQTFTVTLPDLPALEINPAPEIILNPRTGLYEQKVTVTNPASRPNGGFTISANQLSDQYSLHGTLNNTLLVQNPLAPGESLTLTLEYHSPITRHPPTPLLAVTNIAPIPDLPIPIGQRKPNRITHLSDQSILLEFTSEPGKRYRIQYSYDMTSWISSPIIIESTANRTLWLDQGPPKTDQHPSASPGKFYRILEITSP
ncbi:PQQ-binding-like beta-propeller repeat protein [Verrucomicrobiaceae bacterium 227]